MGVRTNATPARGWRVLHNVSFLFLARRPGFCPAGFF
jgi:hypothetical protein